jgi:hypothetical protein
MIAKATRRHWRQIVLALVVLGTMALVLSQPPISQDLAYHNFADQRSFFGIPNFLDVATNLPFLIVGCAGIWFCLRDRAGDLHAAWVVLFVGMALVAVGSGYYHWNPNNETLFWDRLPMTVGFMGLFVAVVGERVGNRFGRRLLVPAVLAGCLSVLYWHVFDDLRFYFWMQFAPLILIPMMMALFRSKHTHSWLLLATLGFYVLAKYSDEYDKVIFRLLQDVFSGHSLKHLLAALGGSMLIWMLAARTERPVVSAKAT